MKLTSKLIGLIAVVVIAGILAAAWFFGASPLLDQAKQSDEERAQVEAQNDILRVKLQQMKTQFENIEQYRAELERIQTIVPDEEDPAIFYTSVQNCVTKVGAVPNLVTTEEASAFLASDGTDPLLLQPSAGLAEKLFTVRATISFDGSDEEPISTDTAISFLDCMHSTLRIFTPVTVEATQDGKGSVSITGYLYRVTDPAVISERLAHESAEDAASDEGEADDSAEASAE